jgi:hypothetical protein
MFDPLAAMLEKIVPFFVFGNHIIAVLAQLTRAVNVMSA